MLEVFELLTVKCKYSCNGCTEVTKASLLTEHEAHCKFSHIKHKKRGPYNKVKLYDISRQYAKRRRLLPMFSMLDEFCDLNNENTEDVLFSMLATTLYDNGKKELANKIEYLWVQQTDYILTADECLASRVDLLQTKNQYREQFDYLNSKGQYVFKPPNQVDSVEKTYLPSYVNYELLDGDKVIYSHKECVQEPINLMSDFRDSLPNFPTPNVVGVRWSYKDAVAKALSELNEELSEVPNDIILHALIKDGGDGLGDVSQYKEKGDRCLSDKAFRYAFCIMNVKMEDGGEMKTIWEEEAPGSVRTNRCLIESICDENQTAAMVVCVAPVEAERQEMSKSIMRIQIGSIWRNFSLRFVNSMVDEKRTRADGGLQGAGSSYLCDLCYATQKTAKSDIGTFVISRKLEETKQIADLLHFNPDKLNPSQLSAVAKGHKVDATHAKINLGKFVYKLLIREVAGVNQWEESADVKHLIQKCLS
ncbi:unnamed protein product [Porites evermanni]|uniref:V(D)J recombination-activating protein 1 n=1 Tax=Porites evermanni TaxID=104178 RepID=A0ABN8MLI8_9CNID|nr:unnamed protein product [Porites evermanni]